MDKGKAAKIRQDPELGQADSDGTSAKRVCRRPPPPSAQPIPLHEDGCKGSAPSSHGSAGAACNLPPSSSSSSSATSARKETDVDLSFAKLEGKPVKFIRRVMGEAKRLLCPKGLEESRASGCEFELLDQCSLSKWAVRVFDLNAESQLAKDLRRLKLEECIHLEMSLPDGFPLEPPFVRVVYPYLVGGFVFGHGGICFEPLTPKGWMPAMTLPALAISIKGILDYGDVQCKGAGNREAKTVPQYSEKGARADYQVIVSAHRGGDSFGSLSSYKS